MSNPFLSKDEVEYIPVFLKSLTPGAGTVWVWREDWDALVASHNALQDLVLKLAGDQYKCYEILANLAEKKGPK